MEPLADAGGFLLLRANPARSVEKYERAALFTGCCLFVFPPQAKKETGHHVIL